MELTEIFLYAAELAGTAAFAVSGALIAVERGLDAFGVLFLSVITALGGGVIRDILLGALPPLFFTSYEFLGVAAACALVVFIVCYIRRGNGPGAGRATAVVMNIFDAVGLGVFAVIGTRAAVTAGYGSNAFMCIFLGMTTGIGGGVLRDMMSHATPIVLRKQIYALAAIIASGIYYTMTVLGVDMTLSVCVAVGVTVLIRILAAKRRWKLPRVYRDRGDV